MLDFEQMLDKALNMLGPDAEILSEILTDRKCSRQDKNDYYPEITFLTQTSSCCFETISRKET